MRTKLLDIRNSDLPIFGMIIAAILIFISVGLITGGAVYFYNEPDYEYQANPHNEDKFYFESILDWGETFQRDPGLSWEELSNDPRYDIGEKKVIVQGIGIFMLLGTVIAIVRLYKPNIRKYYFIALAGIASAAISYLLFIFVSGWINSFEMYAVPFYAKEKMLLAGFIIIWAIAIGITRYTGRKQICETDVANAFGGE